MSNIKSQKMASDLKVQISLLIKKLKDPRISSSMISVLDVKVSNDCSNAKIYISSIEGYNRAELAVLGLNNSAGYIKKVISNTLRLKKSPNLIFIADNTLEYAAKLDKIMDDLKKEDD